MVVKAAYFAWNGTLVKDDKETDLLDHLAYTVSSWTFGGLRKSKMQKAIEELKSLDITNKEKVEKIYAYCNSTFLKGFGTTALRKAITEYAMEAAKRLDRGVLDQIRDSKGPRGTLSLAVIGPTPSYEGEIRETLKIAGYNITPDATPFVLFGNNLDTDVDGDVKQFNLNINDDESRVRCLRGDIGRRGVLKPADVFYMGGLEIDELCFDYILREGGICAVSLKATEEFREKIKKKYKEHADRLVIPETSLELWPILNGNKKN